MLGNSTMIPFYASSYASLREALSVRPSVLKCYSHETGNWSILGWISHFLANLKQFRQNWSNFCKICGHNTGNGPKGTTAQGFNTKYFKYWYCIWRFFWPKVQCFTISSFWPRDQEGFWEYWERSPDRRSFTKEDVRHQYRNSNSRRAEVNL